MLVAVKLKNIQAAFDGTSRIDGPLDNADLREAGGNGKVRPGVRSEDIR